MLLLLRHDSLRGSSLTFFSVEGILTFFPAIGHEFPAFPLQWLQITPQSLTWLPRLAHPVAHSHRVGSACLVVATLVQQKESMLDRGEFFLLSRRCSRSAPTFTRIFSPHSPRKPANVSFAISPRTCPKSRRVSLAISPRTCPQTCRLSLAVSPRTCPKNAPPFTRNVSSHLPPPPPAG